MSKIPGEPLLGCYDFFGDDDHVGATPTATLPNRPTSLANLQKRPGMQAPATSKTLANPKGGQPTKGAAVVQAKGPVKSVKQGKSTKPSPHKVAMLRSVGSGRRAVDASKRALASVTKYKKDVKSGKHAPLVPLKAVGKKDGTVALGAAAPKKLSATQQKAVAKHTNAIAKNARLTRRLSVAAVRAQKAGNDALAFVKKATPFLAKKLGGKTKTPTRVRGLDYLGSDMLFDESGMPIDGSAQTDPVDYNVDAGTDADLMNQQGAGGLDPASGAVFAPDGRVLYDPNNDPDLIPLPARGEKINAEQAKEVWATMPEDGIPFPGVVAARDAVGSWAVWYGPEKNPNGFGVGFLYGFDGREQWLVRTPENKDPQAFVPVPPQFAGNLQAMARNSIARGWGPLVGRPGSEFEGLQLAVDTGTWFWQGRYAPPQATAEMDAKIAEANAKVTRANQAAALVEVARITKEQADQMEAQAKQEAANALAMSAADTQAAIAEKAAQAKERELSIQTSAAQSQIDAQQQTVELELAKQQAQIDAQAQALEMQLMQQQAQIDAAQQHSLIEQANIWNLWARQNPAEAVAQMQQQMQPYPVDAYDEGFGDAYGAYQEPAYQDEYAAYSDPYAESGGYEGGAYDYGYGGGNEGMGTPSTRRVIDVALGGMSWDMGDTALTIMNPAYGLYRLFGGKSPTSGGDEPVASIPVELIDPMQRASYREAAERSAGAEQSLSAARQRLAALQTAQRPTYTPIMATLPSFSLNGGGGFPTGNLG